MNISKSSESVYQRAVNAFTLNYTQETAIFPDKVEKDDKGFDDFSKAETFLDVCKTELSPSIPLENKHQVCVLTFEDRKCQRQHQKSKGLVRLSFHYNPDVNGYLKATGRASFDRYLKCWDIPIEAFEDTDNWTPDTLAGFFNHFKYIAIPEQSRLYITPESFENSQDNQYDEEVFVHRIDGPVTVSKEEVIRAALEARPDDLFTRVYIQNGDSFIPYPEKHIMRTHVDTLLVRIGVTNGRPRYFLMSLDLTDGTLTVISPPAFLHTKPERSIIYIYCSNLEQLDFELGQAIKIEST